MDSERLAASSLGLKVAEGLLEAALALPVLLAFTLLSHSWLFRAGPLPKPHVEQQFLNNEPPADRGLHSTAPVLESRGARKRSTSASGVAVRPERTIRATNHVLKDARAKKSRRTTP